MTSSVLVKYHQDLLETLTRLQKQSGYTQNIEDQLDYLINWLKIRQICLQISHFLENAKEKETVTQDAPSIHVRMLAQFKRDVQPKLLEFTRRMKNRPFSERIMLFTDRMRRYIEQSQYFIKDLPSEALKIFEDNWFFLQIFRFTLDQRMIHNQMALLRKKMVGLKKAFEIEAGTPDMVEQQNSISSEQRGSLKASSSPSISPSSIETPKTAASNSTDGGLQPGADSSEDMNSPILTGDIFLPEAPDEEISVEEPQIQYPTSTQMESGVSGISVQPIQITGVYPYSRWYPPQNLPEYWSYRFCNNCGIKLEHPSGRCTHCGFTP